MEELENISLTEGGREQADLSTIQHASEMMKHQRGNSLLRTKDYVTADFPMYRLENGEVILYLAGRENNLILQNLDEAAEQMERTGCYRPTKKGIEQVVESAKSGDTLRIKVSDLDFRYDDNGEYVELEMDIEGDSPKIIPDNGQRFPSEINLKDLANTIYLSPHKGQAAKSPNKTERQLIERIYGTGKEFEENMETLKEEGLKQVSIFLLSPAYVSECLKKNPNGAIGRLSFISFDHKQGSYGNFYTDLEDLPSRMYFRGVRKTPEEVDAVLN